MAFNRTTGVWPSWFHNKYKTEHSRAICYMWPYYIETREIENMILNHQECYYHHHHHHRQVCAGLRNPDSGVAGQEQELHGIDGQLFCRRFWAHPQKKGVCYKCLNIFFSYLSPHHSDQSHKCLGSLCSVVKCLTVSGKDPSKGHFHFNSKLAYDRIWYLMFSHDSSNTNILGGKLEIFTKKFSQFKVKTFVCAQIFKWLKYSIAKLILFKSLDHT